MKREDKERAVAELAERLKGTETLIVADYRGLTMPQIDELRTKLLESGAKFSVVKNTLTRRAAEAAGADALVALLDGPTAVAFLENDGDPIAVAKALADTARTTRVLAIRGGILEGKPVSGSDVEELAKLPPAEVLKAQLLGAIAAPVTTIVGLFTAPLQNLVGLIDARIEQLEAQGGGAAAEEEPAAEEEAADGGAEETSPEAPAAEETTTEPDETTPEPEPAGDEKEE